MAGTRTPAMRIDSVANALKGGDAKAFADFLRRCPLLDGRELRCEFSGGAGARNFAHGLGRSFRGVLVVGVDDSAIAMTPASVQGVISAGLDPAVYIRLNPSGATSTTATVWVF